jgi:hypothetical protein
MQKACHPQAKKPWSLQDERPEWSANAESLGTTHRCLGPGSSHEWAGKLPTLHLGAIEVHVGWSVGRGQCHRSFDIGKSVTVASVGCSFT